MNQDTMSRESLIPWIHTFLDLDLSEKTKLRQLWDILEKSREYMTAAEQEECELHIATLQKMIDTEGVEADATP